jgi:hypothetical protein
MSKIIRAALAARFNASDLDALLEIINATEQPEIATELLLGIYEQPDVNFTPHPDAKSQDYPNMMFEKYDKWTDKVHYTYDTYSRDKDGVPIGEGKRQTTYMSRKYWNTGQGGKW